MDATAPHYRRDLAWVHDRGFGMHAERCAEGILSLLRPIGGGLVLELGCGSGALTRHLVDAGHRVVATDASPAMVALARQRVPDAEDVRQLALPGDRLPDADAIVSVGHVLNYLPDAAAIRMALIAIARALRSGGLLALDMCDLRWGAVRRDAPTFTKIADDWTIITRFSMPSEERFVRDITTFVRNDDGSWRRDDERHNNVLIDTSLVPGLLQPHGVRAQIRPSFGERPLPEGLVAVVGDKEPARVK